MAIASEALLDWVEVLKVTDKDTLSLTEALPPSEVQNPGTTTLLLKEDGHPNQLIQVPTVTHKEEAKSLSFFSYCSKAAQFSAGSLLMAFGAATWSSGFTLSCVGYAAEKASSPLNSTGITAVTEGLKTLENSKGNSLTELASCAAITAGAASILAGQASKGIGFASSAAGTALRSAGHTTFISGKEMACSAMAR